MIQFKNHALLKNLSSFLAAITIGLLAVSTALLAQDNTSHGKPTAPVVIGGSLTPNKDDSQSFLFTIKPQVHCDNLVTKIRGLEGVTITGLDVKHHNHCDKEMVFQHSGILKSKKGKPGYVAIEVQFTADSQPMTAQHILLVNNNGTSTHLNKNEKHGQKITDNQGRKFMIMPSDHKSP